MKPAPVPFRDLARTGNRWEIVNGIQIDPVEYAAKITDEECAWFVAWGKVALCKPRVTA